MFSASQNDLTGGKLWTSLLLMNGVLMSNGLDAISVPAARAKEVNEHVSHFRTTKDATAALRILADCRYRPEQQDDLEETQKLEAVVCALVLELLQVRVPDKNGNILAITPATTGVGLTQLVEGQRLMCIVTAHLPRVLDARLIVSDD